MIAEIISVGTELLLGNTVNTNAHFLANKCASLGISSYYQVTVGDNENRLKTVIETALSRSDLLIISGGLGPTEDDITKEVTAKVLGKELVHSKEVKQAITDYFEKSNRKNIPNNNWKQSYIIEGGKVLKNRNGTAPGLIVENEYKMVILLPGPPGELIPMFENEAMPYLREYLPGTFYSQTIKLCGIGESQAVTIAHDLIVNQTNPTIAPYAKPGEVNFRITASAKDEAEGEKLVEPVICEFRRMFGKLIFTTKEEETLEEVVVNLLIKEGIKLTTAESCTGGLLSGRIINVAGASEVFDQGFTTYSNEAKEKYLGVKHETLENYGAVSKETAWEMAVGAGKNTASRAALAVTGVAGPEGGTKEKPVGLVYIGVCLNDKVTVKEFRFNGNRQGIRERSVINALDMLRLAIMDQYEN